MIINYSVQTCDTSSYQEQKRFCSNNRTEITKKSITSFLISVKNLNVKNTEIIQNIKIFDDSSTEETKNYLRKLQNNFSSSRINIDIEFLQNQGLSKSLEKCYSWLKDKNSDYIYHIQDDYLFKENCLNDVFEIFNDIKCQANTDCIVRSYNDPHLWSYTYKLVPTLRTIFVGKTQYWLQNYDLSCSFFTSKKQFMDHWDLYEKFFYYIQKKDPKSEPMTINRILSNRGILGIIPFESISLHMQSDLDKDPYLDWKSLWDSVIII